MKCVVKNNEQWAVFLDIDRTLTNSAREIPPENLEAIALAREAGHRVYINTGRSWGNIPDSLFEALEVDGYIAGNGAHIYTDGKTLLERVMPISTARDICEYILSHDELWCIFECVNGVYSVTGGTHRDAGGLPIIESLDDFDMLVPKSRVQVIAAGTVMTEDFISCFSDSIDIIQFPTYADCVIKGCNKALGIEQILSYTGIPRENTIAIGDSGNDMDMLRFCEVGVAMDNAEQKLKDIADFVSLTNDECGVSYAMRKLLNLQRG